MSEPRARRSGRPRSADGVDHRANILAVASAEFAEHGYEGVSVRGVARRAGVDPALVHHYFGDKTRLFAAALGAPDMIQEAFTQVFERPRETLAEDYLRFALEHFEDLANREQMSAVIRTALGGGPMAALTKAFVLGEVNARFAAVAAGPDPALRAELVSTQLLGLFVVRYVLATEPLASASIDDVVASVAPTIHRYQFEELPVTPTPAA
jgi:AcrR family transcriptional regulator